LKNLKLPPSVDRRWAELAKDLERARMKAQMAESDAKSKVLEVDILRAEVMVAQSEAEEARAKPNDGQGLTKRAQNKLKEAQDLLEEAKKASPQDIEPWIALAGLAGREGRDSALNVLQEAKKK